MIKYALRCSDGHDFDSWFQSAEAFDTLDAKGLLCCAVCGGDEVRKALMAPKVSVKGAPAPALVPPPANAAPDLSEPMSKVERAMAALRAKVEANATWVGKGFAKEVRAQHEGAAPERPVWGQATPAEAKALADEGLPVAPLPFGPRSKSN